MLQRERDGAINENLPWNFHCKELGCEEPSSLSHRRRRYLKFLKRQSRPREICTNKESVGLPRVQQCPIHHLLPVALDH